MNFKDHCAESIKKLGYHFSQVHQWLDAFAGTKEFGMRHRKKRHHLAGIEEVRDMWGDDAAEAARRYAELVPDCVRILGPDDSETLHARRLLAYYTEKTGDVAEAMRLYAVLIPDCVRVLGPDHRETLFSRDGLANVASRQR